MIDKATVKRIIDAADIVDVVGDYVHLIKRGSNYMGLCPFHNEKTPSFSVSRSRNICHCFSCGKGGSPVNFIMEKEGISYRDALLRLADKYGIKVEERVLSDEERQEQSERESMLIANDWAMRKMHHDLLETDEGRDVGLQYLYQREITQEAIDKFKLGYAIDDGKSLGTAAANQGYSLDILKAIGLCGVSQNGQTYDRFRGRVIFPIINSAGKVVAFGGRGIKGEKAKYINSPESPIYKKSNELYGIYQARNSIVRNNKCYLVEGYLDVIGMWQSGMENTVASSGTSLTDGQIALIHRFTENVTLIYDGDPAGIKASLRGIDLLLMHNLNIKIVLLPDGDDPDSFSHKHTPEEFRQYIADNETDFIEFKTKTLLEAAGQNPQSKSAAIHSIVTSLASISDMIKRSIYIQECSRQLNVAENLLVKEVSKAREGIVENQKKQREKAIIDAKYPEQETTSEIATQSPEPSPVSQPDERIIKLERNVLDYCIRFGMLPFSYSDETGSNLNVAEYIADEMNADNITYSLPAYQKTFQKILDLTERYKEEEIKAGAEIDSKNAQRLKEWFEEMSHEYHPLDELEKKEQEFRAELQAEKSSELKNFALKFIGDELGSDIDNDVRKLVLESIIPKYKLSKYHSKSVKIESDEDKLYDLVPRAITEWKDGIIAKRFKDVQMQLKSASENRDNEAVEELLKQLTELSNLRCAVAKNIGERIITPK